MILVFAAALVSGGSGAGGAFLTSPPILGGLFALNPQTETLSGRELVQKLQPGPGAGPQLLRNAGIGVSVGVGAGGGWLWRAAQPWALFLVCVCRFLC